MSPEQHSEALGDGLPDGWTLSASAFNWAPEIIAGRSAAPELALGIVRDGLAHSMEIEAGQLWRGFPDAAEHDVVSFREQLDALSGRVSIVGLSIDEWDTHGRPRTESERFEFLMPQLETAHRLGARGVRLPIGQAGVDLWQRLLPTLHELDLVLYEEIQGQQSPGSRSAGAAIEQLVAFDNDRVRLLVDISMLMPALPTSYVDRLEAGGVPAELTSALRSEWLAPDTMTRVLDLLGGGRVAPAIHTLYMNLLVRFGRSSARDLKDILPWVGAIHLKFWDLDDAAGRISSPISELAGELRGARFEGTLCSEWGGHEWLDDAATDMTRRHLTLARHALRAGLR